MMNKKSKSTDNYRYRAFKFRLILDDIQKQKFINYFGCCRYVYNHMITKIKEDYKNNIKYNYKNISSYLTSLKKEPGKEFLKETHSQVLQQSLMDFNESMKRFFKKISGFPKYKKKYNKNSCRFPQNVKLINRTTIKLPSIGLVKIINSYGNELHNWKIKHATVSRESNKYYISLCVEKQLKQQPIHSKLIDNLTDNIVNNSSNIGIDMGVVNFVTTSDNIVIKSPISKYKLIERKIKYYQRKLSRCSKFSNNWKKVKIKIQRLHQRIKNIRNDFLHKSSHMIVNNHAVVCVESLNIKNMTKHLGNIKKKFNHSILNQGWYEFQRQLEYKLNWLGGKLIKIIPNFTSQRCNICKHIDKHNRLSQSQFKCIKCGHTDNADHNAALNILEIGLSSLQ